IPIEAAAESGVIGGAQVRVCKTGGGKLRTDFEARVGVLGGKRHRRDRQQQQKEPRIAVNQTKHVFSLPLLHVRTLESCIPYFRITSSSACSRDFWMRSSRRWMGRAIFVVSCEIAVHILVEQIVRRGKANLAWRAAADADFLFLPHPSFQVWHLVWGHVYGGNAAAQRRVRRSPGNRPALHHF